ncbi:unnamed protein product [Vitrella brassicaformis CCMP3155]|uniref:Galactosylgalactosylxylosylprotein 3-beta-glucuronosyltransferase n=2 Tax=Vitrella brassicaformis TaxID=1169539 RepID=A0A0G4GJ30_VITBC|nr:unnamed protein product [Vitrella brassicaformis CCMP3155]|eukprot:CEM29825.1 unnamed protein product [Vitrella brassicaformis CCMP3155]
MLAVAALLMAGLLALLAPFSMVVLVLRSHQQPLTGGLAGLTIPVPKTFESDSHEEFLALPRSAARPSLHPVYSSSPSLSPTPYWHPHVRWVFVITPSKQRYTQRVDLVRLMNTLSHIDNLHWILVEDNVKQSPKVDRWLNESRVQHYTHLFAPSRAKKRMKVRGSQQRNRAILHLKNMIANEEDEALKKAYQEGVVYFADDDNAYSLALFDELRRVKSIGVWPVAFTAGRYVERCILNETTGHIASYQAWNSTGRAFPIDMGGFGIHTRLFLPENASADPPLFDMRSKHGQLESDFLGQFGIPLADLEPLADNCTKVNVWHVKTKIDKIDKDIDLAIDV